MPDLQYVKGEGLRLELEHHEAELLRELLSEMKRLLEADVPRVDPVRARLFPDAYDEPAEAEKYHDMVGDELMANKRESLRIVGDRLGRSGALATSIPEEEVPSWLALLTDLRLAIGTRLEVTEETMEQELEPEDADAPALGVLHWLGWIQGTILEEIDDAMEGDA